MNLLQLAVFLASGIGQFFVIAVIIGMFIPKCLLEIYGFIVAFILIIMFVLLVCKVFSSLK